MEGEKILRAEVRRPDLRFPFPERFAERLTGRKIIAMGRRAKYLLCDLEGDELLVMHLGMSGSFRIDGAVSGEFHYPRSLANAHDHVVLHLTNGVSITYNDPRRFGFMLMMARGAMEQHALFKDLGPEPVGNALDADYLASVFAGRKTPIKSALLDQKNIAGLGNIYVCEALFRSGIAPDRKAESLVSKTGKPLQHLRNLVPIIREVIAEAIEAGGSSLRDHAQPSGELGYFQHRFAVYDREGETCITPGCGSRIQRMVQSGRSTFYCPTCQK